MIILEKQKNVKRIVIHSFYTGEPQHLPYLNFTTLVCWIPTTLDFILKFR